MFPFRRRSPVLAGAIVITEFPHTSFGHIRDRLEKELGVAVA